MHFVPDPDDFKKLPISVDREVMHGVPCFRGTRVPLDALWNNLADGMSLDEFIDNFPTVRREDAVELIEFVNRSFNAALAA